MPAIAMAYLLMCGFATRRRWQVRGHHLELPSARIAMLQLVLSTLNWAVMAGVLFTLLGQRIDYPTVLGVLLIAAVAGAVAHVPAGLGVLEAVFVALLGQRVPPHELLAALLAYRAIYYLAPLVVALVLYAVMEARMAKKPPVGS